MVRTRGVLLASALALAGAPSISAAQTRCEAQAHDNKVAGTVIGGVLGALAGNALSRGGGRTGGTIIGGVAGAAIGNNLSRTHCPDGYAEVEDPDYVPPPAYDTAGAPPPPASDPGAFWHQAPTGVEQRIDWMQTRIEHSRDNGSLDPRQLGYAQHDLNDIRRMDSDLRTRDGGALNDADRSYLQSRLDALGHNLRWMRTENAAGE
jgi:hypothetical protein